MRNRKNKPVTSNLDRGPGAEFGILLVLLAFLTAAGCSPAEQAPPPPSAGAKETVEERDTYVRPRRRRSRSRRSGGSGPSSPTPPATPPDDNPTTPPDDNPTTPPPETPPEPAIVGFCNRTAGVRAAVLASYENLACSALTQPHLDQITQLVVALSPRPSASGQCREGFSSLRSGDFSGLRNLKKITFGGSEGIGCLKTVPEDIFSGLSKLEEIHFGQQNLFTSFPQNVFRNLPKLKKITLPECLDPTGPAFQNLGSGVTIVDDC